MAAEFARSTSSPEETAALGAALGQVITSPLVIALYGEMGSGKTTFVRGLARGLGVEGVVNSPTYTLMQRYEGRLTLDHYDAWMEGREREVLADGAHELLGSGGVSIIEWADRVEEWLPEERLGIWLQLSDASIREVVVRWRSKAGVPSGWAELGDWSVPDMS